MSSTSRKILTALLCLIFIVAVGCVDESSRDDVEQGDAGQDTDTMTDTGSDDSDAGMDAG